MVLVNDSFDSFFNAFAYAINEMKGSTEYTAKSFRLFCEKYAQDNSNNWLQKELALHNYEFHQYLDNIRYISAEIEQNLELKWKIHQAILARHYIEGRIICGYFGINLHIIHLVKNDEYNNERSLILEEIVDGSGSVYLDEGLPDVAYADVSMVHLVCSRLHYAPLQNKMLLNSTHSKTTAYLIFSPYYQLDSNEVSNNYANMSVEEIAEKLLDEKYKHLDFLTNKLKLDSHFSRDVINHLLSKIQGSNRYNVANVGVALGKILRFNYNLLDTIKNMFKIPATINKLVAIYALAEAEKLDQSFVLELIGILCSNDGELVEACIRALSRFDLTSYIETICENIENVNTEIFIATPLLSIINFLNKCPQYLNRSFEYLILFKSFLMRTAIYEENGSICFYENFIHFKISLNNDDLIYQLQLASDVFGCTFKAYKLIKKTNDGDKDGDTEARVTHNKGI